MWTTLSSVIDWLAGDDWYDESMPFEVKLTYQLLLFGFAALVIYILEYSRRKIYRQYHEVNIDGKIEEVRRRYKALKAREAVFCNLNFGGDKKVKIGKFTADTDIEKLREAINMIQDAIDKDMKFTSELCDYIQPFVKDLTGDGILPEEMELEDVLAMLQLFAAYLEEKEPVRARRPQPGEIIYPPDLAERVEEIKEKLKKLDDLITIRRSSSRETLMYVSRKGEVEEIKKALKDLESVMQKRSEESVATLLADHENPTETSPGENLGTLVRVPSSTYLADTESLSEESIDGDNGTKPHTPSLTGNENLAGTDVDDNRASHANACSGNNENKPDIGDLENSGTQASNPDHENMIEKVVDEKCDPCSICLFDPENMSDTSSD